MPAACGLFIGDSMDRQIVYPGQILPETSLLQMAKDAMIGVAKLSAAVLGTSTMANGFAVTPTGPASLQVVCAPGEIYSLTSIDALAFSTLPADTTHSIMKQGILLDGVTLSCPAPGTTGQSINYLIQVTYQDSDSTPVLLPYYNSANPALPYSGMGNNGLTQNTNRKGVAVVAVKAGASAATGSQVTPAPDAGYVGLYVVTVAFGQTTITAGSITQYSGAPILPAGLLQAVQRSATVSAADIGTANAYSANFTPAITTLTDKMVLCIKAVNANTTASTFTPAPGVIAAAPIVGLAHAALQGGEIVATGDVWLQWNSTVGAGSWILLSSTGGGLQIAPATKSQHAVQLGQIGHGLCRLTYLSATSIKLSPYNGNVLVINGAPRALPAAGVTLSNGGLSASTLYYIYAFWTGSAIALEASATGHSQDATTGVEIKTGDATRTLVGMIYANASSQFADAPATRHVASYFNRRNVGAMIATSAQTNFSTTSFSEISATHRVSFLTWGDEAVDVKATGQMIHGTIGQSTSVQSYVDGVAYGNVSSVYEVSSNAGMTFASANVLPISGTSLAEGQHLAQLFGAVTGGGGALTQLANSVMVRI